MITLADYVKDWPEKYPEEYLASRVEDNAKFLLHQVNTLLQMLNVDVVHVTSGWRPREHNEKIGGAKNSYHIVGRAVDIADPLGGLAQLIKDNPEKLRSLQLWMEDPAHTKTWVHLDNGMRKDRASRIFNV